MVRPERPSGAARGWRAFPTLTVLDSPLTRFQGRPLPLTLSSELPRTEINQFGRRTIIRLRGQGEEGGSGLTLGKASVNGKLLHLAWLQSIFSFYFNKVTLEITPKFFLNSENEKSLQIFSAIKISPNVR